MQQSLTNFCAQCSLKQCYSLLLVLNDAICPQPIFLLLVAAVCTVFSYAFVFSAVTTCHGPKKDVELPLHAMTG